MKKYCWNGSGNWWKNIAEMKAGLMKNIAEMEARVMKKYCWNGSGIDEKVLLKWKRVWRKNIAEMEADWWKSIAEMEEEMMKNMAKFFWMREGFSNKLILYTLRRIVRDELSRRIVRAELSCAELSGHPNDNSFSLLCLVLLVKWMPLNRYLEVALYKCSVTLDYKDHWRRLGKNIGWANPNFLEGNAVKTDKCMGIPRFLGACPAAPQSLRLWQWHAT